MRLDEIISTVVESEPDDWEVLLAGPDYQYKFVQVGTQQGTHLEIGYHSAMAVYRHDIDIRLAFGMPMDRDLNFGWSFPDPQVTRDLADVFYRGALVYRWSVYAVDGGRAYVPQMDPSAVTTGDGAFGMELAGWTASSSDTKLARLVHVFNGGQAEEFDSYLKRTTIVVRQRD